MLFLLFELCSFWTIGLGTMLDGAQVEVTLAKPVDKDTYLRSPKAAAKAFNVSALYVPVDQYGTLMCISPTGYFSPPSTQRWVWSGKHTAMRLLEFMVLVGGYDKIAVVIVLVLLKSCNSVVPCHASQLGTSSPPISYPT